MEFVGNKAKERIWKRVFQENKARQISPLINTGFFSKNSTCFAFLKHPFSDLPFCLITDDFIYRISFFLLKPKYSTVSLKLEPCYTFLTKLCCFSFITVLMTLYVSLYIFLGKFDVNWTFWHYFIAFLIL